MRTFHFKSCGHSKWGFWIVLIIGLLAALDVFGADGGDKTARPFTNQPAQPGTFLVQTIGEGPAVILVPGLGCSGDVWYELVQRLVEKGHSCHVVTFAGFAGTASPDTTSIDLITKELAEYIKSLKKRPVYIGHSLGGFVGLKVAALHPQVIDRLIVVDALPFLPAMMNPHVRVDQVKPQAAMMRSMMVAQTGEQFAHTTLAVLKGMIADTSRIKDALEWAVSSDRRVYSTLMYELMTTDLRPNLADISVPVFVVGSWAAAKPYGMTEEMAHRNFQNQYHDLASVQIRMARSGFHFIMWDEPAWLEQQIVNFLKGAM